MTQEAVDPAHVEALWGTYEAPALAGIKKRVAFFGPLASVGVDIDDGRVTVSPDVSGADCSIRSEESLLLLKLVMGEVNLVTSLLQGRIQVEGDPMLAIEVAGSMPELGRLITERVQQRQRQKGDAAWQPNP